MNMQVPGKNMTYVAPESELIEFQVENNFLGSENKSFSSVSFGDTNGLDMGEGDDYNL